MHPVINLTGCLFFLKISFISIILYYIGLVVMDMILNRIEDERLFKPYIKDKPYRVEPVQPVNNCKNQAKRQKTRDGDTFESIPYSPYMIYSRKPEA